MLTLDEKKTIGIWYVPTLPTQDWMATLSRADDGGFDIDYRFRYYGKEVNGGDPFLDEDEKRWYHGHDTATDESKAIANMRFVAQNLASVAGVECDEVLMNRNMEQFMAQLKTKPWIHMKTATTTPS